MTRKTSFDELYSTLGALVERATGRPWWRKPGIQSRPATPYATVYLSSGDGIEKQIVGHEELLVLGDDGESIQQTPWNTSMVDILVEFFGSRPNDTALQAASRLRSSLYLEERFWELWEICALSGGVKLIDISAIFRENTEPRVEVRFTVVANIADPLPLADSQINDINSQQVDVTHVREDNVETEITVEVQGDENESS